MSEIQFKPSKELIFTTVKQDGQRMLKLLTSNKTTSLRLHLGAVAKCDSAGLAFLIETKRRCNQYKKLLIIDEMPAVISSLAEFCGVKAMLV